MLYKNAVVKRFKVRVVPERRLKMIELHKEGYNNKQISEIMGIKTDIVSTGIYLARRDKLLPPPDQGRGALVSGHFAARYADVSLLSFFCQRCVCRGAY